MVGNLVGVPNRSSLGRASRGYASFYKVEKGLFA